MAISNFTNRSTSGVDEDALATTNSGEQVRNFAQLTTTGDLADGVFADADHVTIRNFGHIETSGLGAAGVFVAGDDARIENYGSVVTRGGVFDPDPATEEDDLFSEGLTVVGDRFHVANYGSVRVEGELSSGLSGVGVDGVLTNSGRIESIATESSAIGVFGDRSQAINYGQVIVGGENNAAMFALGEEAAAINRGSILMTGAGSVGMEGVITNTQVSNSGVIRVTADEGIGMCGFGDGHTISNFNLIEMRGFFSLGMEASGVPSLDLAGLDNQILNAGRIATVGDLAVGVTLGLTNGGDSPGFVPAANGVIINRGVIETEGDGAAGVAMIGDGHHLTNNGRIASDGGVFDGDPVGLFRAAGVVVSGDDALVENTRSGVIESADAASAAVELNLVERDGLSVTDTSSRLENAGLIKGPGVAVLGGAGRESVVNHGRIAGDVMLGDGADTFVFGKGGTLAGALLLGGGDDLVVIENGAGTTRVADFAAGAASGDRIDVSAFFASFDQLKAHSSQSGGDVAIVLDSDDSLRLAGVQLSALNAGDFLFA